MTSRPPSAKWILPLFAVALLGAVVAPAYAEYDDAIWTVLRTNGIQYGEGQISGGAGTKNLLLDLYEPVGNTDPKKPAIVLIHGGGFTGGNRGSMVTFGNYFAARGYVAVSISYRLLGENPVADPGYFFWGTGLEPAVHAAAVDAKRAVRWLRTQAAALGIDENFIFTGGISAGAITAVHVGIAGDDGFLTDLPGQTALPVNNPGESSRVGAVLDYCGGSGIGFYDPMDPPVLLIHTTRRHHGPPSHWTTTSTTSVKHSRSRPSTTASREGVIAGFLSGLVDGLSVPDLSARFLNRMVWEVDPDMMPAKKLIVRDDPLRPDRRKLVLVAKADPGTSPALAQPALGALTDPMEHGAALEIYRPSGDGSDYSPRRPAAGGMERGWTRCREGLPLQGQDGRAGAQSKRPLLRDGLLKIVGKGAALYGLGDAPLGDLVVRFRLGSGNRWCASTQAGKSDTTKAYKAVPQTIALPTCPDRPTN